MSETITSEKIHISNFDIKYFVQDVILQKKWKSKQDVTRTNTFLSPPPFPGF